MPITRRSAKAPLAVAIMPIGARLVEQAAKATALVLCADPERRTMLPVEALRQLYALTSAEADLTVGLAAGLSLKEISDRNSVSYETARLHLKRIFQKTGTARQAELVRLLMSGPAALLEPPGPSIRRPESDW